MRHFDGFDPERIRYPMWRIMDGIARERESHAPQTYIDPMGSMNATAPGVSGQDVVQALFEQFENGG